MGEGHLWMPKPVQSVIKGNNDALMAEVARLWIKPDDVVADLTYGRGAFWKLYRPNGLICHTDDFIHTGWESEWLDVVVFDPPHIAPGGRQTSTVPDFNDAYGLDIVPATVTGADEMYWLGMDEAERVLKPGGIMMVKCSNYISSGKFHRSHDWVIACGDELRLTQIDEFILHSGTGPQPKNNLDGSPRQQVHSRRAHSFLVILKKAT